MNSAPLLMVVYDVYQQYRNLTNHYGYRRSIVRKLLKKAHGASV